MLASLLCTAQITAPKNNVELSYTTGLHKKFYLISYERYFRNDNAMLLSFGKSDKAGDISISAPGWGYNNFYTNHFSYKLNYMGMFKFSKYAIVKIAMTSLKPGFYAGADTRYSNISLHRVSSDPNCHLTTSGCESKIHSSIISLGPHAGFKTLIARVLTLHLSTAYPFYFPVDGTTTTYLNNYFESSRETPYLGGAMEFSAAVGISF